MTLRTTHGSTGRGSSLRRFAPHSICVLALMGVTLLAQTSNPPAQPPDWENPSGRYAVVMEEDAGLPDHTVYRPANLTAIPGGPRLPIVVFSGPGCDANGTAFRPFFTEVASHGFLLIVSGLPEPKGGSGPNFPKTAPKDLSASLDWATAENSRAGSKYVGRIDTSKVAVMGQSCGGAQSLFISEDPRIDTIVMWNSASFTSGPSGRGRGPGAGAPPAGGGRGGRGGIPVPSVNAASMVTIRSAWSTVMRSSGPRTLPERPKRLTAIHTSSSGNGGATGVSVWSDVGTPASTSVRRRAVV